MADVEKQIVQVVVAVLGSLTPILIEFLKRRLSAAKDDTLGPRATGKSRSLLDLAILLAYSAFLSAILCHSIIVSGQAPSFDGMVLIGSACIAAGCAFGLYLAWRRGIGEMAAGAMSLASLIVLLIAPGSSKTATQLHGVEPGLPLLLPLLALTFATAAALMYVSGNPLARDVTPARRRGVTLGLIALGLSTAIILGYDFVNDTIADEKAPKFEGSDDQKHSAEAALAQLRSLDLWNRGIFYRVASESILSDEYRRQYFEIVTEINAFEKKAAEAAAAQTATLNATVSARGDGANALVGGADNDGQRSTPNQLSTALQAAGRETLKRMRFEWLKTLESHVDKLDTPSLTDYLATRLPFIHPTPLMATTKQVPLSMPGLTASDRYRTVSEYRLLYAFPTASAIPWDAAAFVYPSTVVASLRLRDGTMISGNFPAPPDARRAIERARIADMLFPKTTDNAFNRHLRMQMALPQREEGFLAYRAALRLAVKERPTELESQLDAFDSLTPEQQSAFSEYVARSTPDLPVFDLLKSLADGKPKLDGFPTSAAARLDLSNHLRRNEADPCIADLGASVPVCKELVRIFQKNDTDRAQLAKLISDSDRNDISIAPLFSPGVLDFVTSTHALRNSKEFLQIISDPVTPAMRVILKTPSYLSLSEKFETFRALTPANREQLLLHAAIMLIGLRVRTHSRRFASPPCRPTLYRQLWLVCSRRC